ncbi:MAG: NAD(P)H-binding protein [Mycobacteriaceae bacterium]|nr:NAD(P)H-binding protein [Mycobacteriaceae bacterium]
MRILVTGATGYVGSRLVAALLAGGHRVVTATRDPSRLKRFGWYRHVEAVALDARDATATNAVFSTLGDVDVVYYLVHGIGQPGFRDADNRAAANVAAAARQTGVGRIVYLGGFVPEADDLSEHLTSRAEVAASLTVDGGAEVVWLGAAMIIGAGSTSFEMLRYVGDRFVVFPLLPWAQNPMDPISITDVLYYLVAAADPARVPAGGYDICGPDTTTYRNLLFSYARAARTWRAGLPIRGVDTGLVSKVTALALPVPGGLAADLVESLDHPMTASDHLLRDLVPDPPGGLTPLDRAIGASVSSPRPRPVNALADPHHLADSDPHWAGGDVLALQRRARAVIPVAVAPALELVNLVPGPVAGVLRTGLDFLADLTPNGKSA